MNVNYSCMVLLSIWVLKFGCLLSRRSSVATEPVMLYCRCNDNLAEERDLTFESPREWDLGVWTCRQPQLPMCRLGDAEHACWGEDERRERSWSTTIAQVINSPIPSVSWHWDFIDNLQPARQPTFASQFGLVETMLFLKNYSSLQVIYMVIHLLYT